jgi:hypothetical protein
MGMEDKHVPDGQREIGPDRTTDVRLTSPIWQLRDLARCLPRQR